MSPPILPPGVKHAVDGLDARLEKLEAKSAEIDSRTRRSAAEGARDREQALGLEAHVVHAVANMLVHALDDEAEFGGGGVDDLGHGGP